MDPVRRLKGQGPRPLLRTRDPAARWQRCPASTPRVVCVVGGTGTIACERASTSAITVVGSTTHNGARRPWSRGSPKYLYSSSMAIPWPFGGADHCQVGQAFPAGALHGSAGVGGRCPNFWPGRSRRGRSKELRMFTREQHRLIFSGRTFDVTGRNISRRSSVRRGLACPACVTWQNSG